MSTAMAWLGEIEEAVNVVYEEGNRNILLFHCTANYPPKFSDVNLNSMKTLSYAFKVPVGYSDHTPGIEISLAAVALGACAIEKHITLDRKMSGPDHLASIELPELNGLVKGIRNIEDAMGSSIKRPLEAEENVINTMRRSIVITRDLKKGVILRREDLAVKRPGNGLPPKYLDLVVGRALKVDKKYDELLAFGDLV